jgi:hypothetical protein
LRVFLLLRLLRLLRPPAWGLATGTAEFIGLGAFIGAFMGLGTPELLEFLGLGGAAGIGAAADAGIFEGEPVDDNAWPILSTI